MITVELQKLVLQGHHGVYEEEKKLANTFEVNLDVSYNEKHAEFRDLSETIDYEALYTIIKQKMAIPGDLLEKLCLQIIKAIKKQYPFIKEIHISIYKLRVPIADFQGRAGVSMSRKYKE
jgi:dihydroneopterin aldolase